MEARIKAEFARMKAELDAVRREARRTQARPAQVSIAPQLKLGRITDSDYDNTVPSDSGRVYEFEFVTADFTEAIGVETITPTLRQDTTFYAMAIGDTTGFNVDDVVVVAMISGLWWVIAPFGCVPQSARIQLTVFGSPTGGSFDLASWDIDGTSGTPTFDYDFTSSEVKTEMVATYSNISTDELDVVGGPFPDATIELRFKGDLDGTPIDLPNASWSLTGGSGVAVIASYSRVGIA